MKKTLIYTTLTFTLIACSGETTPEGTSDLAPLINMYGEDSVDAQGNVVYDYVDKANEHPPVEEVELGYKLGPESDIPLANMKGEDSVDVDGNYVYPARDTIFD